jgi:hypothetical protein
LIRKNFRHAETGARPGGQQYACSGGRFRHADIVNLVDS